MNFSANCNSGSLLNSAYVLLMRGWTDRNIVTKTIGGKQTDRITQGTRLRQLKSAV